MAAVLRLPLSATREIITQLLLQPANLGNPDWMPNIQIAEFLRKRVRPVAYFLQRSTCEEWGFVGPMVELPQEEAEDVRALLLLLVGTLECMVSALMKPEIVCMLERTHAISHNSALAIDFPEYDAAGNLLDLEGGFYFPPMASYVSCYPLLILPQGNAKPSHFFGTFDSMGKAKRLTPRFPVHDKFLNLDFPTMQLVHNFEPMAQFAIHTRNNFSWSLHTLAEGKRKAMCQSLRSYLRHTETLSNIIVRYKDLASAHRIPCPSVSWLSIVMRAETMYRFEGDHEDLKRTILRGKLAAVYCYALDLRQNAVDRSFIGEGPEKIADLFPDSDSALEEAYPMDALLSLSTYPGTCSVEDYIRIPEAIVARLELYRSYRREPVEYAHLPGGVLKYVTEVLRPYAETIVCCIPATVCRAIDLPSGHEGEIGIYVADYVCQAAICYDIAMAQAEISKAPRAAINMRCTHALWMAIQLDSRCGSLSAGYAPQG
ncbi:hypothetical protein B0H17DRAFT_1141384 [Mycena rosella]|uniref:Uncharacterized protein n=1 Tax=Mycena rosella TaxID=1033263 RepID=A0AAD7G6B1_MYCRO|nr:hypothetical protein B0H17DRAFT_1141384 [Mycena rosella]